MADDIVTRLRIACRSKGAEYCDNCQPCDAANEIERLRAEVTRWKNLASDFCMEFAMRQLERGDA